MFFARTNAFQVIVWVGDLELPSSWELNSFFTAATPAQRGMTPFQSHVFVYIGQEFLHQVAHSVYSFLAYGWGSGHLKSAVQQTKRVHLHPNLCHKTRLF